MPKDNIVELQEVFRWRLSVNDSRVRINPDTQIVRLDNQDGKSFVYEITLLACLFLVFSIGLKDLHVTIREGEGAPLTIKQIGDETGDTDIGGFPRESFTASSIETHIWDCYKWLVLTYLCVFIIYVY